MIVATELACSGDGYSIQLRAQVRAQKSVDQITNQSIGERKMPLLCVSDNQQNNLVIVDLSSMSVQHAVSVGQSPYPVDLVSPDTAFVSTRDESSVTPVDIRKGVACQPIALSHKPRSATKHPSESLALVGGNDKALTSIIDTDCMTVLFTVGSGASDSYRDFGGSTACGHPTWHGEFILHLDRISRRLEVYSLRTQNLVDSVNLPTSPHHISKAGDSLVMMCEGNRGSLIAPSVVKFRIVDSKVHISEHQPLPIPPSSFSATGGHHLTVDATSQQIFVGTADSRLFTLRMSDLKLLNVMDSGPGCGHVTLCPDIGCGVTTNHNGTAMSVFDLTTGRRTGEITVSTASLGTKKTQGHTSRWFSDNSRLYTTAAQDGKVLEIDVASLAVTKELPVKGAYLIQGCFAEN